MNYRYLPNTNIKISSVCLGTMTFGNQNTESEAHSQLDFALEKGINFIDTAEMYPIGGNAQICVLKTLKSTSLGISLLSVIKSPFFK